MYYERIKWIDISKGIAIMLMVLGHTSIPSCLSHFIWSFHMPLFFVVSGMVTNWENYSCYELITRRFKTLIIPFLIYSVIVQTVYYFLLDGSGLVERIKNGWEGMALWFIPVLFVSTILTKLILSTKSYFLIIPLAIICAFLGAGLDYYGLSLPWNLSAVPYATFFVVVGALCIPILSYIGHSKLWWSVLPFMVSAFISSYASLDMAVNSCRPIALLTVSALCGCLGIFFISFSMSKVKFVSEIMSSIGKETYIILAFSQILIMLANKYTSLGAISKYVMLSLALFVIALIKNWAKSKVASLLR